MGGTLDLVEAAMAKMGIAYLPSRPPTNACNPSAVGGYMWECPDPGPRGRARREDLPEIENMKTIIACHARRH
jgi:hypothetical protein